jgi:hypothetical protein
MTYKPKILLIIKAETFSQVKEAARARGLQVTDICVAGNSTEFRARTDEKNLVPVQRWFHEPGECQSPFGYPIGTLLFFRV